AEHAVPEHTRRGTGAHRRLLFNRHHIASRRGVESPGCVPSLGNETHEAPMDARSRKRRSKARPLLKAGAGIAVAVMAGCGSSDQPIVVGNLKGVPTCDAGV